MGKYDKSDIGVISVSEDAIGDNSQSGIPIFENNNQISILNAILSCVMYFFICTLVISEVGNAPADSLIHWGYLAVYLIFVTLFFYVLKILSPFSFEIFKNITLKNIALAIFCEVLVYFVNYNMNITILQNMFKSSYDILIVGFQSLMPLPVLIYACILGPIIEELLFRGYILKGLRNKYGMTVALLVSSVIFAVFHLNIVQILNAFIMGIIFGLLYIKTGSVFSCMLAHILNNSIAMYVMNYYPPFF